jgi:uncharacterized protein involved in outer membrane biogenesis
MKWPKRILIALALPLAAAIALPFFISLDRYIPDLEKALSARLNEPVAIKSIRFRAFPSLHVTVDGIAVGNADDIKLGRVMVTPDLLSLMTSSRVIRSIEIDSLVLTQKAIDRIPEWTRPDPARPAPQSPPFRIQGIRLDRALLMLDKASIGPFDARITLDSEGRVGEASLATLDGKLKALIKPDGPNYHIDASAKAWTMPVGPPILFDELVIRGIATRNDADLGEISAKLYGGTANGRANVKWQKGLQVHGSLAIVQMELTGIAPLLSSGTHVSGRLNAKPSFSATGSAGELVDALRLETPFEVQHGVIHGVDIEKAATSLIKQGATGGETRFEELSGQLVMERHNFHFTQLKIASGALGVDGNVDISQNKELSGRIHAQLKTLGISTNIPLNVAGTVAAPLLYPTGGTMAGAAVGTAVMGPGVGTAVGAKVGGWVGDLFGGKAEKKPKK